MARTSKTALAALGLAALAALHLWSLTRFPGVFVDEGWMASHAWALIQTGYPISTLDPVTIIDQYPGYQAVFPVISTWFHSLALRIAGAPSLLAMRMVSLTFALALLGALYAIGARLGGRAWGVLAVTVSALSRPFFYSGHMGRQDIMVAALGYWAIALCLYASRPGRWWLAAMAGLLLGVGFEIHPNTVIYLPVILALLLYEHRLALARQRSLWALAAGGIAGLGLYALLHILPNPQTYAQVMRLVYGPTHTPPLLALSPGVLVTALSAAAGSLLDAYLVLLPLLAWAAFAALRSNSPARHLALILAVTQFGSFALLINNKEHRFYEILFSPALDLLLAGFLLQVPWRLRPRSLVRYAQVIAVAGLWAGSVALALLPVLNTDAAAVHARVTQRLHETLAPGDIYLGSQMFWFSLYDRPNYSWESLAYYRRAYPQANVKDAICAFRPVPSVFVIDDGLEPFMTEPPDGSPRSLYWDELHVPADQVAALLTDATRLVAVLDGEIYGPLRVHRFDPRALACPALEGELR